jgi:hypothetical protein
MYFLVYKTTNLLNGKIYIGVHVSEEEYDSYLGSGKLLLAAIRKYGRENFKRETLKICESQEEMFHLESTIVNREFIERDDTYNIHLGGNGAQKGHRHSDVTKEKIGSKHKGTKHTEDAKAKMSASRKGKTKTEEHRLKLSVAHTGKQMSDLSKDKMSKSKRGKVRGPLSQETKEKLSIKAKSRPGRKKSEEEKRKISDTMKKRRT